MRFLLRLFVVLILGLFVLPVSVFASELEVAVNEIEPFVKQQSDGSFVGFDIELVQMLGKKLNFTPVFKSQNLQGLLDSVASKDVDLGIAGLSISAEREKRLDFSQRYLDSGVGILIQSDIETSARQFLSGLMTATTFRLLAGFVLMTFFFGVLLYIVERGQPEINDKPFPGLFEAAWLTWATATTVGFGDKTPATWKGRVVVSIAGFVGIAYFGLIAGHVAAIMTAERLTSQVVSTSDLIGQKVAVVDGSTSQKIASELGMSGFPAKTFDEAILNLEANRVRAVLFDLPVLQHYLASRVDSGLALLGDPLRKEYYGIALPEGSPWLEKINQTLLTFEEDGTLKGLREKYFGIE
jgi:ABC-type amino acid transport substrate-binding protein